MKVQSVENVACELVESISKVYTGDANIRMDQCLR